MVHGASPRPHGRGVFRLLADGSAYQEQRGMRLSPWRHAINQYFAPSDGDGGSGGASGGAATTPAAPGSSGTATTTATSGAAASTTPAATAASDPPALSANQQIKTFAAERGITVEALLSKYAELETANQSATEKAEAEAKRATIRAEAAEQALRDATGQAAVITEATKANALSPTAVYALAKGHLKFDGTGNVTNVAEAIAEVKKAEPKLFAASGGSGDGAATGTTTTREVKPGLDRMREYYASQSGKS